MPLKKTWLVCGVGDREEREGGKGGREGGGRADARPVSNKCSSLSGSLRPGLNGMTHLFTYLNVGTSVLHVWASDSNQKQQETDETHQILSDLNSLNTGAPGDPV